MRHGNVGIQLSLRDESCCTYVDSLDTSASAVFWPPVLELWLVVLITHKTKTNRYGNPDIHMAIIAYVSQVPKSEIITTYRELMPRKNTAQLLYDRYIDLATFISIMLFTVHPQFSVITNPIHPCQF